MNNDEYINQLHASVQPKARCFLQKAAAAGFNLRITSGYRSIEEQNRLYAQGRTTPGSIVTNAKGGQSFHNFALAFDVVDRVRGYNLDWNALGSLGASCGLEHGDRGYVDLPHFQYRGGLSLAQVQAGARPNVDSPPAQPQAVSMEEIFKNIYIAIFGNWPTDQQVQDFKNSGEGRPYTYFQQKYLGNYIESLTKPLKDQYALLRTETDQLSAGVLAQKSAIEQLEENLRLTQIALEKATAIKYSPSSSASPSYSPSPSPSYAIEAPKPWYVQLLEAIKRSFK